PAPNKASININATSFSNALYYNFMRDSSDVTPAHSKTKLGNNAMNAQDSCGGRERERRSPPEVVILCDVAHGAGSAGRPWESRTPPAGFGDQPGPGPRPVGSARRESNPLPRSVGGA